jgi:hypothetical protein
MQWNLVSDADVLEWAVTFVFEIHMEKDLDYMTAMLPLDHKQASTEDQSKVPVKEPTNCDVLFGRGGMTNSHVGTSELMQSSWVLRNGVSDPELLR